MPWTNEKKGGWGEVNQVRVALGELHRKVNYKASEMTKRGGVNQIEK